MWWRKYVRVIKEEEEGIFFYVWIDRWTFNKALLLLRRSSLPVISVRRSWNKL